MKRDDLAARVPAQPSTEDVDDALDDDFDGAPGADLAVADLAVADLAVAEEPAELDERGRKILAFEKQWWRQAGAKEQAIRDTFGFGTTRYYQLLNALLDDPLALAHDPIVVQRLRRLRASRARRR
ncbi:DUF3263 domain-containing protein [Dactylosporangium sp. NPDC051541]|uniref:DUF3263 domain-containing protein n=1 Tax=Dactylosporangium sp. NPDC051541 TaxID=3363977 RepID=UPI0037A2664E